MSRASKHAYFIGIAILASIRSTCSRRAVGCVLVNSDGHIMATGYNGVPAGQPHCIDSPCKGASCESGKGLETCQALHAEWNALLQCPDTRQIDVAYITASPCTLCARMLANTGCKKIVFLDEYAHTEIRDYWLGLSPSHQWIKFDDADTDPIVQILISMHRAKSRIKREEVVDLPEIREPAKYTGLSMFLAAAIIILVAIAVLGRYTVSL